MDGRLDTMVIHWRFIFRLRAEDLMGLVILGSDLWQKTICMKFVLKTSVVCGVWAGLDLTKFDGT